MKTKLAIFLFCLLPAIVWAEDKVEPTSAQSMDEIIQQVRQKTLAEKQYQDERVARFLQDKSQQKTLMEKARKAFQATEKEADDLRAQFEKNEKTLAAKASELEVKAGDLNDVFAIVRQIAIGANAVVGNSMVSGQFPGRDEFLTTLGKGEKAPRITDMRELWLAMLTEINETGKVAQFEGTLIDKNGEEGKTELIRAGVFTAVKDGQYLRYLNASNKFVELSRQPNYRFRNMASEIESSSTGIHPLALDPSKGAILSAMVQSPDMVERAKQGGLIGYIILGIGAIGFLIVAYRWISLAVTRAQVAAQLAKKKAIEKGPLARLLASIKGIQDPSAEVLTVRLDEQLAEETARLSRGLATVAVLAAVSPLLGLLGTVTGMIETFNSITLFGTGDPKLMSGGISVALVTTQLGLAVAIPLVLIHSLVSGKANEVVELLNRYSSELFSEHVDHGN